MDSRTLQVDTDEDTLQRLVRRIVPFPEEPRESTGDQPISLISGAPSTLSMPETERIIELFWESGRRVRVLASWRDPDSEHTFTALARRLFVSVSDLYEYRDPETITAILRKHPSLQSVLADAHEQIAKHFGPNPEVVVELFTEPETENNAGLFVIVRTPLRPAQALERLRQLRRGWRADTSQTAPYEFCIDVECV